METGEEEILPEMHFARIGASSILCGKYIYVFGGYNGCDTLKSCER